VRFRNLGEQLFGKDDPASGSDIGLLKPKVEFVSIVKEASSEVAEVTKTVDAAKKQLLLQLISDSENSYRLW
jgi:phage antirepressor YoqD-like protein